MAVAKNWMEEAAKELARVTSEDQIYEESSTRVAYFQQIITKHCPFKPDVAYEEVVPREPPLLQCIDCRNTESPAGAMARQFNHGRCMHCGGYFKVIRA